MRYGIIGAGMMGHEHIRNIDILPGAEVTAFADPDAKSRSWARALAPNGVEEYTDYRDLLSKAPVDVLLVASPNHTHARVIEDVFATGKPILVEKPLCTTVEDAQRIAERAAVHPGVVWVGMEYRFMAPLARLIEELRKGTAGKLRMLAIREHRMPFLTKVGDWNRFSENTGGTLVEKCCHFFDLMRLIMGSEPVRIYASGAQDVNHLDEEYQGRVPDILDNAFVVVDFEGGARAMLDLCMFAEGSRHMEEITATGDEGKLECFIPESNLVIGKRKPRSVEIEEVSVEAKVLESGTHHGATYYQHLAFLESVRNGTPPEVSADDGLRAVAMGVAAERSAAENRPVEMSEVL
ncbi:MAG: Gfo/Idh/MocA family oxidoreductase [bacterium]|nr:Gfo/Idh/MocA family oxidoreductase [bacterium]MCP5069835.1 Gfo/Idh/MocA family oxidoreductase [bacterium]